MKHRLLYLFLLLGIVRVYAVPIYEYDAPVAPPFQSHKILNAGTVYSGTTYVPFDDAVPSDYSAVSSGEGGNPNNRQHVRKGKIPGADTDPGNQYPLGDGWALAVFAALFAGVIAWKKKELRG